VTVFVAFSKGKVRSINYGNGSKHELTIHIVKIFPVVDANSYKGISSTFPSFDTILIFPIFLLKLGNGVNREARCYVGRQV